jgi:alkylation response protein AidB-like acyl-CoA dehydrogenase
MAVHAPTMPVPVQDVAALADRVDREPRFPRTSIDALAAAGWLGLGVPERFGGPGGGPEEVVAAIEQVARACASSGMVYLLCRPRHKTY